MSDRIDFGGEPWQAIPRRILRDPNLSHRAKGGLVTLLSHEEGWVRSAIAILMHEGACGRKQAQAIMAELRDAGYAELVKERQGNLIKTRYVIYAIPKGASFQPQLVNSSDLPVSGPSPSGSTGKGAAVVDPLDGDPLDEEPQDLKATRERNELFDTLAEIEGSNPSELTRGRAATIGTALAEIKRAAPDVTPEEIRRRAGIYRDVMPPGTTLTAPALATHWARCGTVPTRITGPGARTARRFGLIDEETG